jgi:hypothetical protein
MDSRRTTSPSRRHVPYTTPAIRHRRICGCPAGGIKIPPVTMAHGTRWWEEIQAYRTTLTAEERASLQWDPLNDLACE